MKPFLRYAVLALLWGAVAAYIIYAAASGRRERGSRKVTRVQIEVADSTSQGQLVTSARVRSWIKQSGIKTIGTAVDKVDLAGIERLISKNGFVERVVAYVRYDGVMHIGIHQRNPLVRLLIDGFDVYVTAEGYVFAAPGSSSLYVPVVSGPYRPPFPASQTGLARTHTDTRLRQIDARINELEESKYPLYKRERKNDQDISALRRMRIKRKWWRLESAREFEKRVEELRTRKVALRRRYRYEARVVEEELDRISSRQAAERVKQKKLEKSYEDFTKLLTFVESVEDDDFWRSEVVQIVARTTPSGALEVDLIPRSGRHTIRFGRVERVEQKFDKLLRFYRSGLTNIGWGEYRIIDIRYNDRVVCKK